jgi:catechol 2,3-dioxygenase-like lactoylglutathione lyase family enzyme
MKLPGGYARRLFLGFTCSIMFLVVFALLIAYNAEAVSSSYAGRAGEDNPLTVAIPALDPEETIGFYKKLGFKDAPGMSRGLDIVCMEREGTPYKLEIWHFRSSDAVAVSGGVAGMSFRVDNLGSAVKELQTKGVCFTETRGRKDGLSYASCKDPNGIDIELFQP